MAASSAPAHAGPDGGATPVLPEIPTNPPEVIVLDDDDNQKNTFVLAASSQTPPLQVQDQQLTADEVGQQVPTAPEALRLTPAKRAFGDLEGEDAIFDPNVSLRRPQQQPWSQNSFHHRPDFCHDLTINDEDGLHTTTEGFDGSPEIYMPYASKTYMTAYRQDKDYAGNGDSDDSDADVADYRGERPGIQSTLTRQEKKALDKEIPWQNILNMDEKTVQAYIDAAKAEEASWNTFGSVRPLPREEAQAILRDKIAKKRAFRDKARGVGELKAKCRIVAVGCTDPDLWILQRESATPTRQSEFLVFAIYIAGKNGMLLGDTGARWVLWAGDVKTAFLQGMPERRDKPLYLLPPSDGICQRAGIFQGALLLEVVGNIYGLANAPRTWQLHVIKLLDMSKVLWTRCFSTNYHEKLTGCEQSVLCAIAIVYVDDFLLCHDTRYDRDHLLKLFKFKWGSQNELTPDNSLDFKGKKISLIYGNSSNEYHLKLDQEKFISEMKGGSVSKKRLKETLDAADFGKFRSVAGCLQWLAGQTRPDVSAIVSLCSKGAKSTHEDLNNMYLAVEHLHQTKDRGLILRPVPVDYSTMVVTCCDLYRFELGKCNWSCEPTWSSDFVGGPQGH